MGRYGLPRLSLPTVTTTTTTTTTRVYIDHATKTLVERIVTPDGIRTVVNKDGTTYEPVHGVTRTVDFAKPACPSTITKSMVWMVTVNQNSTTKYRGA